MKVCSRCKQEKEDSEFYARKDRGSGLTSMCKECTSQYMKDKRDNLMKEIDTYKSSLGCQKCGEIRPYVLEFHHNDPEEKEFTISEHTRKAFKNLLPEIRKCSILCANCHKEFHYFHKLTGISTEKYLEGKS